MKTFKLFSLEVVENDKSVEVPLEDGLILNKEDERSTWLIEAYTDLSLYDYFKNISEQNREVIVEAVITKKENTPAYFQTKIASLTKFEKHTGVLFLGHLRRNKSDYSELLLDSLIQKGLQGDALLAEFKEKMKSKPKLKVKNT
ncbi:MULTISPECIES: YwpF-like family protein [Neobacillus]|uniref:YwpF-like family protein n=1 Tax=Neobacillus rhizophilus TaxID=2833579 RepID=A0A942U583_9BACI|nr:MULTISPECIES: YwpF-like family protein [Neobacillus]MBS4212657.1 YwpF-like family protein [Neobacillus rhizophilus]MBU8915065.1 YwpF-like family protein [Bacillus sp. FJAT-29953]